MSNGVNISGCKITDNIFTDRRNGVYQVARLIELAKELEPFDVPLRCLCISTPIFDPIENARWLADHVKRVNETNLDYPVIMDADGMIMDGWHRVVKALVEGRDTIKAVRFEKTPSPDYYKQD